MFSIILKLKTVHNLSFNNDKPKYDFMQNSVRTVFWKMFANST